MITLARRPDAATSSMPRIALASFIGGLLEWYDFYIFATASAIVFGQLFFPGESRLAGTMAAFGAFAAGFLARPLGGLLFGHIGDRFGRKTSLIATLLIIGIGTFLIGVLPTWKQAGPLAPVLLVLLRIAQGIGLGGEYGGASLMTIEHAPVGRRGFWGSLPQAASPGGLLLASVIFSLVALLPPAQFLAWGWRVPFLVSIIMLGVGLFIRLRIAETPEFEAIRDTMGRGAPALELLHRHKRSVLLATGARLAETVSGNMVKSFGLSYVTLQLGLPREAGLSALVATSVVALMATPAFGWISDRVGRRETYVAGAAFSATLAFPFFWVLNARTAGAVWVGFVVAYTLGPTLMLSVQATFFSEMFGTRVRYTALSIAYQVSAILGGFVPLIALSLLQWDGGRPWLVAGMLCGVGLLSLGCVLAAERREDQLVALVER
ncbi:MAG: MHS family MFS transporter [Acidisphaera sp.]|nr:MHS family MFS transporter [Acidisphaera sp.]